MILSAVSRLRSMVSRLDANMARVFIPWVIRHPGHLKTYMGLMESCRKTMEMRERLKLGGTKVPPFLILSITSSCNLKCAGCFAAAAGTLDSRTKRLSADEWGSIISDASSLGVFGFVIAGGEPFTFPGLLDLCKGFRDRLFIIVTNATALTRKDLNELRKMKHCVVLVSIEGDEDMTDLRRGKGVHSKAMESIRLLASSGVLSGLSVTIRLLIASR